MDRPLVKLHDEGESQALESFQVDRVYEFNARATSYFDGQLLAGSIRNEGGEIVGAFAGACLRREVDGCRFVRLGHWRRNPQLSP